MWAWIGKEYLDNLKHQQCSRGTGISGSTLHRLEMGNQNLTLKTLEQLANRLKWSISEVFPEECGKSQRVFALIDLAGPMR
jgi:transcriptional regulator with XRE-family HTH domain